MLPSCQKGKLGSRASPSRQYRLAPGSHSAAARLYRSLSVQQQYLLPPGSHPAAAPLSLSLSVCRKVIGPTSAQTEGEGEARPLLDGCRKVTGTASAQTEGERRGRCWMTARKQPEQTKRERREKRPSYCKMPAGR